MHTCCRYWRRDYDFSYILSCTQFVKELPGNIIAIALQIRHKARQSFFIRHADPVGWNFTLGKSAA